MNSRRFWTSNFRTSLMGLAVTTVAAMPRFGVPLSTEQANDILLIGGALYALLFAYFAENEEASKNNNRNHRPPEPPPG